MTINILNKPSEKIKTDLFCEKLGLFKQACFKEACWKDIA